MIGQKVTIKNHRSGEEIVINDHTDPENVIALQSFPEFNNDIVNNNVPRSGAHGEFNQSKYYGGMNITFEGVIVGENENNVWDIKEKLDRVLQLPREDRTDRISTNQDADYPPLFNNAVRVSFQAPDGANKWIDATVIRDASYDRNLKETFRLDFQIVLRTNVSFLVVEPDPADQLTLDCGVIDEGFQLATKVPIDSESDFIKNAQTVTVNENSFVRCKLYGADNAILVNPRLVNLTNGTETKIRQPLHGSSNYFEIDGLYQTIEDKSGRDLVPFSNGAYVKLDKGDNELLYTAEKIKAS